MNHVESGAYKLLFLLPIFPATSNVLFLGLELEELRRRLAAVGLNVHSASEAGDEKYDIVVIGALPKSRSECKDAFAKLPGMLTPGGRVVLIVSNRFGYARLLRKGTRHDPRVFGPGGDAGESFSTLGRSINMIKHAGFRDINVFAPIPNLYNPSVLISLERSNSLEFVLRQFPDFLLTRSKYVRWILDLMIRTGTYRHILNQYVITGRM